MAIINQPEFFANKILGIAKILLSFIIQSHQHSPYSMSRSSQKILKRLRKQNGFIAIMALGVFGLLAIFGIVISKTSNTNITSISNNNDYYYARDLADSTVEYLQFQLNKHEAGFNYSFNCDQQFFADLENAANAEQPFCGQISENIAGKEVNIVMKVKGTASEGAGGAVNEKFGGECPNQIGGNNGCYVVPFPGTGDAGKRCENYEPIFAANSAGLWFNNSDSQPIDGQPQIAADQPQPIKQIDHSCNWNKLTFGSNLTDRVSIPFYIDKGGLDQSNTANPFNLADAAGGLATKFALRVRTPCKPCWFPELIFDEAGNLLPGETPDGYRLCKADENPTICADSDRYELDDGNGAAGENDVVIQWQLTGMCPSDPQDANSPLEECGLVPVGGANQAATITELLINTNMLTNDFGQKYKAIDTLYQGTQTHNYQQTAFINTMLQTMKNPVLTLFLNNKLTYIEGNNEKGNVPYLEYQLVSDKPLGNPETEIEVTINVNGNIFKKTISKQVTKDLIDFAIQN